MCKGKVDESTSYVILKMGSIHHELVEIFRIHDQEVIDHPLELSISMRLVPEMIFSCDNSLRLYGEHGMINIQ